MNWVDELATSIELSNDPVCEFFTGLPGSGKSTELLRLAKRLREQAKLLPVVINAEQKLDLASPVEVADLLVTTLLRVDEDVLGAEGKSAKDALKESRLDRFWHWLKNTNVELRPLEVSASGKVGLNDKNEISASAKAAIDLKTDPSIRNQIRDRVTKDPITFMKAVREDLASLENRVKKKKKFAGIVVLFDSLEKLNGLSGDNWGEVLGSAERVFGPQASFLRLPMHVIYTIPPVLVLRMKLNVHYMPMIKLHDKETRKPFEAGYEAAMDIIRRRVPDEILNEVFGATNKDGRLRRMVEWSGGYPREIVRLLQKYVARSNLDEATFKRILSMTGDEYEQTIPENAYPWLARVAVEKKLVIPDDSHREIADRMLMNNVVLRYQNDHQWFDLHPAIRRLSGIEAEIRKLDKG